MPNTLRLLVGTRKGAFIYTADDARRAWTLSEPLMPGWTINHMVGDVRAKPARIYAAANHPVWGPAVAKSADGGKNWDWPSKGLGFPADMGLTIESVWHIRPGHDSEPGVVYAATAPAALFRSEDDGVSWRSVDGITRHPFRDSWQPTPGGVAMHSIEIDPRDRNRMYIALSAGGSYVSDDGGTSWELFSHSAISVSEGARVFISQMAAMVPPDVDPAVVNDMHRLRLDPQQPDRIWTQAHTGVFRSDDCGKSWTDVTNNLPSFHGFPIALARSDAAAAYVVPLETGTDNFRVCPGQLTVYRTRDLGATWQPLTQGLPDPSDYQSVYREGMDTDGLSPEGVYFGTSNGEVYASADGGDHWQRLPGTLPPVLSVTCMVA